MTILSIHLTILMTILSSVFVNFEFGARLLKLQIFIIHVHEKNGVEFRPQSDGGIMINLATPCGITRHCVFSGKLTGTNRQTDRIAYWVILTISIIQPITFHQLFLRIVFLKVRIVHLSLLRISPEYILTRMREVLGLWHLSSQSQQFQGILNTYYFRFQSCKQYNVPGSIFGIIVGKLFSQEDMFFFFFKSPDLIFWAIGILIFSWLLTFNSKVLATNIQARLDFSTNWPSKADKVALILSNLPVYDTTF